MSLLRVCSHDATVAEVETETVVPLGGLLLSTGRSHVPLLGTSMRFWGLVNNAEVLNFEFCEARLVQTIKPTDICKDYVHLDSHPAGLDCMLESCVIHEQ
jgi:hypothetical protein